jgi:hypothetical protein
MAQEQGTAAGIPAKMLVSLQGQEGRQLPDITPESIVVTQGRDRLHVTHWSPAKNDPTVLFVVIDDACDTRLGGLLDDVRSFIKEQPRTTAVGVAYMRNNVVRVEQEATNDHDAAAQKVRLPIGNVGFRGSPYLSLMDLIKRWPTHEGRRQMVVISDGIDRFRPRLSRLDAMSPSPDVRSTVRAALTAGILIHTIYAQGVGFMGRNMWEMNGGVNGLSQLSDETGGESFFIGYQNPPSFRPDFARIQNVLNNQYWLGFDLKPGTKSGLQAINTTTEVSGAEIVSASAVYVPGGK